MKFPENEILIIITRIRANNNRLWMGLLRLALRENPVESKKIIKQITKNDREVSRWLSRL